VIIVKAKIPRIMITAPSSNSGKTTVTVALLKAFLTDEKKITAYKAGPDYIDPMFHKEVIKIPSRNLDQFMLGDEVCKYLLCKNSRDMDISILEGVMGYYDGIGTGTKGSSYELARLLNCPVVMVVNCNGMSLSVCAIIEGFKNFRINSNIRGVILNKVTKHMYEYYKKIIETNIDVKVYGYMPYLNECKLDSRHLGLITPQETDNLERITERLGNIAQETIDIKGLYELSQSCDFVEYSEVKTIKRKNIKIAIARDKAFCFYYEDSLNLLKELGAELIEFSPLNDKKLPDGVKGLYIGGGYPELYMERLSGNISMIDSLRNKIKMGLPTIAECGGYMYLLKSFMDEKNRGYQLVGIEEGQSSMTSTLRNFGYIELTALKDNMLCKKGETINAHEFHYSKSNNSGNSFLALKPESAKNWECIIADDSKFMGYPHLHFWGNVNFANNFIGKCIEYGELCL
jgi:cobyrinic acid a,c-diamide synthase